MTDRVRFLRPLRNDDIGTSDRKFDLLLGKDDDKISLVLAEINRLEKLAGLQHPFVEPTTATVDKDPLSDVRQKLKENRPRRKFYGL